MMTADPGYRENVASHRIADSLRTAILEGSYLPGTRIRQEDVAARSGASRIPVREALRMLDSEGLVTLVANSGAWVTRLTLGECVETYLIRERLEPLLLRTSLPNLDAGVVDRLGQLAGQMEGGAGLDGFPGWRSFLANGAPRLQRLRGAVALWNCCRERCAAWRVTQSR